MLSDIDAWVLPYAHYHGEFAPREFSSYWYSLRGLYGG